MKNQNKDSRKQNTAIRVAAILLCLVLLTTSLISGFKAKFKNENKSDEQARVAAFVFDVTGENDAYMVELSDITKPGDSQTIEFKVTGAEGTKKSEVSIAYDMEIRLNGSMPISTTITKDDGTEAPGPVLSKDTTSLPVIWQANDKLDVGTEDVYTLVVTWPASENDAKYASDSAAAEIQINVTGTQID